MTSKAHEALEFAREFLAGIEMETDGQDRDREAVLYAIDSALDDDPITAAVDAELQPLREQLVDVGHTLAKGTNDERYEALTRQVEDLANDRAAADTEAAKLREQLAASEAKVKDLRELLEKSIENTAVALTLLDAEAS